VKNRFQSLPFKCNLQRYSAEERLGVRARARLRLFREHLDKLSAAYLGGALQVESS
jgi:hypothetical protein